MQQIKIQGGKALSGDIDISGSKNAALPVITACLLTDEQVNISCIPELADIKTLYDILTLLGVKITRTSQHSATFQADNITSLTAPYELVKTMRASVLVLGPLLARFKSCKVALPGGCAIGVRPVNFHLDALEQMGAKIEIEAGYINASVNDSLKGAVITFPKISVGATENTLMAASLAQGTTVINNAATEPEITDLANLLVNMGADIQGIGTHTLTVKGVKRLHSATHKVIPDRIETATYMIAAAITRGCIKLHKACPKHIQSVIDTLNIMGANVTQDDDAGTITCNAKDCKLKAVNITTEVYPGFPTDVQAQIMALMLTAEGKSFISETVFENRFMHVPEMQRMNADITFINDFTVAVNGGAKLTGAPVMASDLRASAGLVLAGLVAEGTTLIDRVYHLDRGYENLENKLALCGADICRIDNNSKD